MKTRVIVARLEPSADEKYYFIHSTDGKKYRFFINDEEGRQKWVQNLKNKLTLGEVTLMADAVNKKGYDVINTFEVDTVDTNKKPSLPILPGGNSSAMTIGEKRAILSNIVGSMLHEKYDEKIGFEKNWEIANRFYDKIVEKIEGHAVALPKTETKPVSKLTETEQKELYSEEEV